MATVVAAKASSVSPYVLALRAAAQRLARPLARVEAGELAVEIVAEADSLWAFIRRPGRGGLAHRVAFFGGKFDCARLSPKEGEALRLRARSALGEHRIVIRTQAFDLECLRFTVSLTPAEPLVLPFMPRDLYPIDANGDPTGASGHVEASQRGLNSGLLYFQVEEPEFGNVLYFQNFTALNGYFQATRTTPDEAVGGEWPELGFLLPTHQQSGTPPIHPLPAGQEVTVSDAVLVFRYDAPTDERDSARHFLQMLGQAYRQLDLPETDYRDWVSRAESTLRDLDQAPEATIKHYGHRYIHPYTASEYPDVIHAWGTWCGKAHPLEREFKAGLRKFYDRKLKTLRRYLPNVGDDKDADAVDSWYLYHPLLNLGALALKGDRQARRLFMDSLDYGIRAAHHFDYKWPIQYKVGDFSVVTAEAADGRGQTDVGGIYAWVMLEAFELTDDKRYLDEARAAIDAAVGLRFNINYQANLTAWGAAACLRLWRITNEPVYLQQSYVYLGSFFHNCQIWESKLGLAVHYSNFLGVTCLQDAPYMAIYECFDSFAAFEHCLADSGPDLEPAARMLIAEYCKYALYRAWFYYPDALPPAAIAEEQRENNGHIDRKLSFPLEDLYADGQRAGQVGQEIYGCGAAFTFATRAFHHVDGAPFRLYCDHFVRALERTGERTLRITLDGGETCTAGLSLVRLKRRKLTKSTVSTVDGDVRRPHDASAERIDYRVPATGRIVVSWE
jgi:hypothetical protein